MIGAPNRQRFACVLASILMASVSCVRSISNPIWKDNPSDRIEVFGTLPDAFEVELFAVYQTTVVSDTCAPTPTWLSGVPSPEMTVVALHLDSRIKNQRAWSAWRDLVLPGKCGWQLRGIEYKADRSTAAFQLHKERLIENFIADACLKDNITHVKCPADIVHFNDDESQPVHHFCKFSVLDDQAGGATNACAVASSGKTSPSGLDKHLHLLRPQQHTIQFELTDIES